jgi:hypothetical protein
MSWMRATAGYLGVVHREATDVASTTARKKATRVVRCSRRAAIRRLRSRPGMGLWVGAGNGCSSWLEWDHAPG